MKTISLLSILLVSHIVTANQIQSLSISSEAEGLKAQAQLAGGSTTLTIEANKINIRGKSGGLQIPIVATQTIGNRVLIKKIKIEGDAVAADGKADPSYKIAAILGTVAKREIGLTEVIQATAGGQAHAVTIDVPVDAKIDQFNSCTDSIKTVAQPQIVELSAAIRSNGMKSFEVKKVIVELASEPCKPQQQ